jgi:hypothetical protein
MSSGEAMFFSRQDGEIYLWITVPMMVTIEVPQTATRIASTRSQRGSPRLSRHSSAPATLAILGANLASIFADRTDLAGYTV